MPPVNYGITPAPTFVSSPSREAGCSRTNPCLPTSKQDQRKKFLEELGAGIETTVIPIEEGGTLSQALEKFRESPAFSVLMKKTIDALEGILLFTKKELGNEKSTALERALGLMLHKMRLPRMNNPWFQSLSQTDQEQAGTYSTEEMWHAYQSNCLEFQVIENLMQLALRGDFGLTQQQAKDAIKPLIAELPLLITVCGAGSLMNIRELLKNLQDQLLPCDLSGQFDNRVELIAQEHIRETLCELFNNDLGHVVQEIHRVKAVRFFASSVCNLPVVSIDGDHYAQSFLDKLNGTQNASYKSYNFKIRKSLDVLLKEKIRPDIVCVSLAKDYFDRIKCILRSKEVDVENIPYNSKEFTDAVESLASEYGKPPVNYLFEEVCREDYSRCLSHSPTLLASWFLLQLVESTPSVKMAVATQRTLLTKSPSTQGNASLEYAQRVGSKIQDSQHERVYQIHDLFWTTAENPNLGFSEQLKIENISPSWVSEQFKNNPIDKSAVKLLIFSLANSVNCIKSGWSDEMERLEGLRSFLKSPEISSTGFGVLSDVPLLLLDSYEKIRALLTVHLAAEKSPDETALGRALFDSNSISQGVRGRKELINKLVDEAVSEINKFPELAVADNPIVKIFVSKIFNNKYHRSKNMLRPSDLISWAIENKNSNLTRLIVQEYKAFLSSVRFKEFFNGGFQSFVHQVRKESSVFYKWPDYLGALRLSALGIAVLSDDLELAKVFVEEGLCPNEADRYGYTPLVYAAASGSKKMLEYLIGIGARLDGIPSSEKSAHMPPILAASMAERVDMVEALLKAGADVNQRSSTNQITALYAAYLNGNLDVIKKLYEYGAEHNIKATFFESEPLSKKTTPLKYLFSQLKSSTDSTCKMSRRNQMLKYAQIYVFHHVHHQIPFDGKVFLHGYPLIHALTYQKNLDALKMLIDSLSDQPEMKSKVLNVRSSRGTHKKTPLMVAAKQGATEVAAYLLSHPETDILLTDSKGRTALQIAAQYGKRELCELLSQHMSSSAGGGVDFLRSPLSGNMGGRSPFHRFFHRRG